MRFRMVAHSRRQDRYALRSNVGRAIAGGEREREVYVRRTTPAINQRVDTSLAIIQSVNLLPREHLEPQRFDRRLALQGRRRLR
jgi:hypothetical protein